MMIWHDNPVDKLLEPELLMQPPFLQKTSGYRVLASTHLFSCRAAPALSTLPVTSLGHFLGRRCGWLNGGSVICYRKQAPLAAHARNKPQHPWSNTSGGREALASREWRDLATWYA
jgi:hypothetical protein